MEQSTNPPAHYNWRMDSRIIVRLPTFGPDPDSLRFACFASGKGGRN